MERSGNDYIDQLTAMHMNTQWGHTSPHKADMLLSVIDLFSSGETAKNRFTLSPESLDDDPRNGLSLCKNHHWAMDQELIFPCFDNLWHVRKDIDDRIDAHLDLINLNGKTILPPEQKQYSPKRDALLWREHRLKEDQIGGLKGAYYNQRHKACNSITKFEGLDNESITIL